MRPGISEKEVTRMGIEIRNQTDTSAELYLSGDIVDDDTGGIINEWYENSTGYQWPDKVRQQLDALTDKDLTIYINSDGGSVSAGVAMANMIARHKGHTTAVVDGWCCSIATQIFFAADTRRIPANAYLMIHKPAVCAGGNADELRKQADTLDTIQQGLETTYQNAAKEGVTPEQITAMVDNETWLTGRQAAEYFDVDVLGAVSATACAGRTKQFLQHIPDGIRFKDKVNHAAEQAAIENKQRAAIALALSKGAMIQA